MDVIEVVAPGMLTTVQDLGREGFGPVGVSESGAADAIALRVGNRLVGNPEGAAALEMTLLGGTFRFAGSAIAALAGSDFGAALDGEAVEPWASFLIREGQTLSLGATRSGARCYLCLRGGIDVKAFLGSASTHVLSGLGGFQGRALRKDDVLAVGNVAMNAVTPDTAFRRRAVSRPTLRRLAPRKTLRVTEGPQSDWFAELAQSAFYSAVYRVSEAADRMGLRLQGAPIAACAGRELITEGVSLGAIQVPSGGQPIIVFVDQQTTGGYPKIANVISADLHCVGQLRPRDEIRFERVSFEMARALLREQEALLACDELIAP